jgi:ADP-ribose pyrophosphatase
MPKADVKSNQVIYKGRIIGLELTDVRLPHGAETRMEVVRHPGSCVIVPMPDPDHLMLVRQYRFPVDEFLWELPAGSLKPGEDPQAGAERECAEEIGLLPGRVENLGKFYPSPGYLDEYMMLFRMTELREPTPDDPVAHQDEDEHIEVRTFSLEEARAMVKSGEIKDLKTAMVIAMLPLGAGASQSRPAPPAP